MWPVKAGVLHSISWKENGEPHINRNFVKHTEAWDKRKSARIAKRAKQDAGETQQKLIKSGDTIYKAEKFSSAANTP